MERKYLLPKLNNKGQIDVKECWKSMDYIYDYLIENLELFYEANESVFEGGSNAVPHMFEQMLLFHKAFLDENNRDHNRAVAEWRAVLSVMALQKVCNIKLDVLRLDLVEGNKNPLLKAAYEFCPEDKPIFYNTTWDFLYIVRIKEVPVAIFSPITLVCPAKQFKKKLKEVLDKEFIFIGKVNGMEVLRFDFKGKKREFSALTKWLKILKSNLGRNDASIAGSDSKYEKVCGELERFIQEYAGVESGGHNNPMIHGIYSNMNSSMRKEYSFLNFCCDVDIKNNKLRFLLESYKENIFLDKILVLVNDDEPDTMSKAENIYKLKECYRDILSLDGRTSVIEVHDSGGKRLAACVFLPFKNYFVESLIQNQITPNEFFGSFSAIYNPQTDKMEIGLKIKGFPYNFAKDYPREQWQYIESKNLKTTYLWPTAQIDVSKWKNYYIYTVEDDNTGVEVSVPEAVSQVRYFVNIDRREYAEFQLCKANQFPAYLRYSFEGVDGFLPIWTRHQGTDKIGSVAHVILDVGHATTSIAILKKSSNGQGRTEEIRFQIPRSRRIAGRKDMEKTVNANFVLPDEDNMNYEGGCIKNMLHSFCKYRKEPVVAKERKPFEDGQILFDNSTYLNEKQQSIVSYINFDYALMDEIAREKVHIFLEQLLLYIVYQVMMMKCSYVKIYFLHCYDGKNAQTGELEGLWKNALWNVRSQTGIHVTGKDDVTEIKDYEALSHYVLGELYRNGEMEACEGSEECINIGMNIGWKNTTVAILTPEKKRQDKEASESVSEFGGEQDSSGEFGSEGIQSSSVADNEKESDGSSNESGTEGIQPSAAADHEQESDGSANESGKEGIQPSAAVDHGQESDENGVRVDWARLAYAGRDISMLKDAEDGTLELTIYPLLLTILLSGNMELHGMPEEKKMLEEFSELFDTRTKDLTHYQGIFDVIAMKIDEANYKVSPDVYNNMLEFRYFLMDITYNMMLLFMEVGLLAKKYVTDHTKKISVFLGGNGAKFLKWISNDKYDFQNDIGEEKAERFLVLPMVRSMLDYIVMAAGGAPGDIEVNISLADRMDEQLVHGCKIKEFPQDIILPEVHYEHLDDTLQPADRNSFLEAIDQLRQDVFQGFPEIGPVSAGTASAMGTRIVDIIDNDRKVTSGKVNEAIKHIHTPNGES